MDNQLVLTYKYNSFFWFNLMHNNVFYSNHLLFQLCEILPFKDCFQRHTPTTQNLPQVSCKGKQSQESGGEGEELVLRSTV